MNPSTQHEKTTQTADAVRTKKVDWIDLSGHESLTPPLPDVEETPEESDRDESNEESDRDESNEESDKEEESDEETNEEKTIPGDWVCIIYDRDYWSTTENKYLWTGRVVEENDTYLNVDCGLDEGIHIFRKRNSFFDFSKNVYDDCFGWTVRIHRIEYNYETQRIVDKTAGPENVNAYSVPESLQIPTIAAIGYMLFISLIGPMFHTICQTRDEL